MFYFSCNTSKTSASVSSGVPNTEKQMKARGRRPSAFIAMVSRCLEPLMKHEARVFGVASQNELPIIIVCKQQLQNVIKMVSLECATWEWHYLILRRGQVWDNQLITVYHLSLLCEMDESTSRFRIPKTSDEEKTSIIIPKSTVYKNKQAIQIFRESVDIWILYPDL